MLLIVPALLAAMSAANAPRMRVARFQPDEQRERPLPPPVEIQLGLDAPNPPSETWVGYEQYQKHAAALSPVEQAAFTDDPVAAAMQSADMRPITPPFDAAQAATARQQLAAQPEQPPHQRGEQSAPPQPLQDLLALSSLLAPMLSAPHEADDPPRPQPEAPQTQPAAEPAEPRPPQPPQPEEAVSRQASGAPNTGARSDRESDPTSTVDVPREHWQLGKPLAAHGLELKPRRPDVTILTQLTAWPRNPTARITFDRTGVPTLAVLGEDTGDSRVDAAIVAALYRWRAAGKPLQQLGEGDTIDITIRLLINPERKRIEGD